MDRSSIVLTAEQQLLVKNSLEFVHWTIANLIPKSNCRMEYDDLFQEGCVALCHAAASYHGGTSFKTYAITVIRNHLIDCCRKQTNWRKYISEQSLDDPDAGLPTPFCTDRAHFPVWTPAQCLPPARCIIAVLQSSALTRSSSKRRALTARILQRSITPAPTMSAHGSPARQRSSAATRIFWTLSTSPVEIVSWRP